MSNITQILNWISNSLLLPVMVLLLIALVWSLILLGGFFTDCFMTLGERRRKRDILEAVRSGALPVLSPGRGVFAEKLNELKKLQWNELECEKRISEWACNYERKLEQYRFMVKVGPMLGLMGTLIPMGPALAGLASGDIGSMAYNIQIAFATTVVGCVVAGIGVLVHSVRRHDYREEIQDLHYVLDLQ